MRSLGRDLRSIPNLVTLSRLVIVAVMCGAFFAGYIYLAMILGVAAGISDHLDGILARRLNQVTDLGEVLDQFSDLILESTVFLMLVCHPLGPNPTLLVVYLARELWVTTIRRYMASRQLNIKSSIWGKVKTNFIGWSFIPYFAYLAQVHPPWNPFFYWLGLLGLCAGLAFSYYSAYDYTRQFIRGYNQT